MGSNNAELISVSISVRLLLLGLAGSSAGALSGGRGDWSCGPDAVLVPSPVILSFSKNFSSHSKEFLYVGKVRGNRLWVT
jgi:hypothetical protein